MPWNIIQKRDLDSDGYKSDSGDVFSIKMLRHLFVVLFALAVASAQNSCQTNRLNAAKSGAQAARGTNLGSWFALESWMAPAPWDENGCNKDTQGGSYLLEKCLGSRANSVMEKHWSSWIKESDFAEMSQHGVNVARLPVGWWHVSLF